MFYVKAFAATLLALIGVTYAMNEAARPTFGAMVLDAADNAQALGGGAVPAAPDRLASASDEPVYVDTGSFGSDNTGSFDSENGVLAVDAEFESDSQSAESDTSE